LQTDTSSTGRVTGGNLTLFFYFVGANLKKKDATVAKVKKNKCIPL